MDGAPLEGAKKALIALVRRLEPTDNFGLVTFDDSAQVVVPAGPLTDKDAVIAPDQGRPLGRLHRPLRRLPPGSAGDPPRRHGTAAPCSSSPTVTSTPASRTSTSSPRSRPRRTPTASSPPPSATAAGTTRRCCPRSRGPGSGNHVFADNPDAAGAAIAGEVDGLLNKVVQALSLTVKFEPAVEFLRLYNDLPAQQIGDGQVMIELGDLYAEEARKVLLKLKVPAMAALGLARIATLELAYVELPGLVEHVAALPITRQRRPRRRGGRAGAAPDGAVRGALPGGPGRQAPGVGGVRARRVRRGPAPHRRDQVAPRTRPWRSPPRRSSPRSRPRSTTSTAWRARLRPTGPVGSAMMSKMSRESFHRMNRKRGRRVESDPPRGPGLSWDDRDRERGSGRCPC